MALVAGLDRNPGNWEPDELEDVRAVIRAGIRKFLHPPLVDGRIHQWRFLERQFVAQGEPTYITGTIAVVAGVVTLTGGTWPTWADDAILRVGSVSYYVDTRTSGTVLALETDGTTVASGTTFELHRWRHPMPTDFGELIDGAIYSSGSGTYQSRRLQGSDEAEIRLRHAVNFRSSSNTGDTCKFAVYHGDDNDASDWYFSVWPVLDDGAFVSTTYRAVPLDNLAATLTDEGTNVQMDPVHAETLLASIQSATEEYFNDSANQVHSQRFFDRLKASIAHDRHSQGPVEFNRRDGIDERRRSLLFHTPTYNDLL